MRDISIVTQTPAADLDRFAAIESMIAKVKRRGRSDNDRSDPT
jgi:hypothetical protein